MSCNSDLIFIPCGCFDFFFSKLHMNLNDLLFLEGLTVVCTVGRTMPTLGCGADTAHGTGNDVARSRGSS